MQNEVLKGQAEKTMEGADENTGTLTLMTKTDSGGVVETECLGHDLVPLPPSISLHTRSSRTPPTQPPLSHYTHTFELILNKRKYFSF